MSTSPIPRRTFLQTATATASATAAMAAGLFHRLEAADAASGLKGHINHSACKWCYPKVALDDLCRAGKEMGLTSIDLVDPPDFDTLKKHGLTSAMISFPTIEGPGGEKVGSIPHGFNNPAYHDLLVKAYEPHLKASADFGAKHVICFSGNRNGMDEETGIKNCVAGLKKVLPIAEKHGITLVMELLNSKVNHKDYMCDKSAWGVELCKQLGSPNFKLLYDIYHMQIMEGDVIATIKRDNQYFAHYHTGGVPGRHEIDETQELYYPAIMKAIVDTGYKGHVAQEFIPARPDALASLKQAVGICDV
ncbi:hydroxypyruvate isomerase [Roseimicrobium gellanilyticum]|uniref:Hydroxypyruvate isomerase n=1 Tax=Roseimicrobium gellanilyticum TaxID=748857 RepID=A0A366H285_9BACT|nr:TIM barrel protein [Roseimicrobium gellanilyticum]RBP35377.1 hydroxypyruvate isomerase [Roseimicrobium gellanilyticum]